MTELVLYYIMYIRKYFISLSLPSCKWICLSQIIDIDFPINSLKRKKLVWFPVIRAFCVFSDKKGPSQNCPQKLPFSGELMIRWGWRRRARGHPTFRGDNPLKKYLALQSIIEKGLNALRLDDSLFRGKGRPNIFSSRGTSTLHLWMLSAPAAGLDRLLCEQLYANVHRIKNEIRTFVRP